ncbi:DUF4238 domain-containing protein [Pseudomonas syringae group genomosp. 3]|uniref:DUF4238 domain-containing protein n=1 Tax=Pseudomonas syringae pv. primulae TaxID=251707 RepID=A0A3M5TE94_9PSED|nr:DUF4238 domain-containing protein [Pseudomonas syringae group genomosp. 3]RMO78211.1 hypothetical protein ALQ36_01226 [Pseudomonas syringae pv. primulae]RMU31885.1 hypothetical protein ALP30_01062 [Pseudomonas syringae pv. primulae]
MEGIKKDNHYVPQAYLRQWVSNGKILTYRLLVPHEKCGHWKPHSPKSIAKHQHLYTYFSGSKDSDEIERWLDRDFEQPASMSISKVVNETQLSVEDWNNLFRFAVAQSIRTPTGMKVFMKRQSETLEALLAESMEGSVAKVEAALTSGIKLEPAPAVDPYSKLPLKLRRVKNEDGSEGIKALVLNGRKFWIWHLEHLLKNTIHRMPVHRWTILHAPTGVTWPTTDNPFTRLGVGANGELSLEGGWGVQGTRLFLPLSPKHLLFTCVGHRPPPRGTTVSLSDAAFFRTMIINGASRYIFATDTRDIVEFRPRTVSRELFDAEAKLWSDWHVSQSEEEAQYPNL